MKQITQMFLEGESPTFKISSNENFETDYPFQHKINKSKSKREKMFSSRLVLYTVWI